MKKSLVFLSIIFLFVQFQNVEAQKRRPTPKPKILSAREIANKVLPSVVLIITQDENGEPISQGSGFVYKPGLVVSNLHVFERATNAVVKNVKTGEVSKAVEVVAMNARQDICIIRIDNTRFPVLSVGDSRSIQTGDEIYVASNPKGFEGSFTKGIVSSIRNEDRAIKAKKGEDDLDRYIRSISEQLDRTLFQIDAAISPGSSGGVLVNTKAQAIGIVKSSVVSGQNLNFAIPIEQLISIPIKYNHPIQLAGACAYKDRDKETLKGAVKKVIETSPHSKIENGRFRDLGTKIGRILVYDRDGSLSESEVYDAVNGKFAWKYTFDYDENHIKTRVVQQFADGQTKEILFDLADGIYNKLSSRFFSSSVDHDPTGRWIYDSNGRLTERRTGGAIITFKYDADNRGLQSITTQNGQMTWRNTYTYKNDGRGNWIIKYVYTEYMRCLSDPNCSPQTEVEVENYREITYYDQ